MIVNLIKSKSPIRFNDAVLYPFEYYLYDALEQGRYSIYIEVYGLSVYWLEYYLIELSKDKEMMGLLQRFPMIILLDLSRLTLKKSSPHKRKRIIKLVDYLIEEIKQSVLADYIKLKLSEEVFEQISINKS